LHSIRPLVNAAPERLSGEFDKIYSQFGRDSIAPEKLLRALLLQAFFSVRSERQLMEQITYNMMFRWFVGLSMDAPVWDVTVFTKNRDRLLKGDIARAFLAAILVDPAVQPLLSDEHFSVDGTLIEAWASMKSFKPKEGSDVPPAANLPGGGRNAEVDFRGQLHSNETHASTTDPDARPRAQPHRRAGAPRRTLPPSASISASIAAFSSGLQIRRRSDGSRTSTSAKTASFWSPETGSRDQQNLQMRPAPLHGADRVLTVRPQASRD
jgi:transposase